MTPLLYVFVAWELIKHRCNFTFTYKEELQYLSPCMIRSSMRWAGHVELMEGKKLGSPDSGYVGSVSIPERSEASTVFGHSNVEIAGSNPAWGMDACLRFYVLCCPVCG
jgi:hypothetical protein